MPNSPIGPSGIHDFSIPQREKTAEEIDAETPRPIEIPEGLPESEITSINLYIPFDLKQYDFGLQKEIVEKTIDDWKKIPSEDKWTWDDERWTEWSFPKITKRLTDWANEAIALSTKGETPSCRYKANKRHEYLRLHMKHFPDNGSMLCRDDGSFGASVPVARLHPEDGPKGPDAVRHSPLTTIVHWSVMKTGWVPSDPNL
ncbi:MAG: hypothetical protein Q9209_001936 [Squamulea sp. 1 TL-2023]